MERFLNRLSVSEYKDEFVIKGGSLVSAMVGIDNRSTMDIDVTVKDLNVTHLTSLATHNSSNSTIESNHEPISTSNIEQDNASPKTENINDLDLTVRQLNEQLTLLESQKQSVEQELSVYKEKEFEG